MASILVFVGVVISQDYMGNKLAMPIPLAEE